MEARVRMRVIGLGSLVVVALATPGLAQESVAYSYDVHGRLTQVARVNASGPDATSAYVYDPADNRTTRTITVTASRAAPDQATDANATQPVAATGSDRTGDAQALISDADAPAGDQ